MTSPAELAPTDTPQTVALNARLGNSSLDVKVSVTPTGLLAIGGLVSSILLSTAVLVYAATSVARRHPVARALMRR